MSSDTSIRFDDYQRQASQTSMLSKLGNQPEVVALLGLGGEAGSVQTLYKKRFRDGDQFLGFRDKLKEELGDVLWYLVAIASCEGLSLNEIAVENLNKTHSRWLPTGEDDHVSFDGHFPETERLPRSFVAHFEETVEEGVRKVQISIDGREFGAQLRDNAYVSDGYRFHDIFHMTEAVLLGWSPVFRALLKLKRKSDPETDEVEDGGRAIVTDEALAAVVFSYALRHQLFENIRILDWQLLDLCRDLTQGFEVGKRSTYEWEQTILKSYEIWRAVEQNGGGWVRFDGEANVVEFSTSRFG